MVCSAGYHPLGGATGNETLLLLDASEDLEPLLAMIVLHNNTLIPIWWKQCPPTRAINLLFRRHSHSESRPGTRAPFAYPSAGRRNQDNPNPHTVASKERADQLESNSAGGSNRGQPESGATVGKQGRPRCPKLAVPSQLMARPNFPYREGFY